MFMFLHDMGYTYFNIGCLTYTEINYLIDCFVEREKLRERNRKKSKGKKR